MNSIWDMNTNIRTLEGARNILTVKNSVKLGTSGPLAPGTEIRCLRPNSSGYYMPCIGFISSITPAGRFVIDLWADKSERICVSAKAVLWPTTIHEENVALGKRGTITFSTQEAAEGYLKSLPGRYVGRVSKQTPAKWMVSYHRKES